MSHPLQEPEKKLNSISSAATTVAAFLFALVLALTATQPAHAQTFQLIHSFTGPDGYAPSTGLTIDSSGDLYGTTGMGGTGNCMPGWGCGTAFKLTRTGSGWSFATIHDFQPAPDGEFPESRMVFGPDGSLYGTTVSGGTGACLQYGCGIVFKLTPGDGSWTESILLEFNFLNGGYPSGRLAFDAPGNLYGTTSGGGTGFEECSGGCLGDGVVYKLNLSGGAPTETVLHDFYAGNAVDGIGPEGGVTFDNAGNLYGTTTSGSLGLGYGTVFRLSPSGSNWNETILYRFDGGNDGANPWGGLIFDPAGNLYGTTAFNSFERGAGTVFELAHSNGNWVHSVLYDFPNNCESPSCNNLTGPWYSSLTMDAAGNLYGTTLADGAYGKGSVFKLTHSENGWTYTSLHDFTGGSDGAYPWGDLTIDSHGTIYGTASSGGINDPHCSAGCGTVFEITP